MGDVGGLGFLASSGGFGSMFTSGVFAQFYVTVGCQWVGSGGSGTNSASMSFGSMQAFGGTVPSGVTKTTTGSSWTISTPFDVKVTCTNLTLPCNLAISTSYVLTAQLQSEIGRAHV